MIREWWISKVVKIIRRGLFQDFTDVCMVGPRTATRNKRSNRPGRDSKRILPEYRSEELPLQPARALCSALFQRCFDVMRMQWYANLWCSLAPPKRDSVWQRGLASAGLIRYATAGFYDRYGLIDLSPLDSEHFYVSRNSSVGIRLATG
jgi:hypothetical protein